jgi:hypothetical protein
MARESLRMALNRASSSRWPLWGGGPPGGSQRSPWSAGGAPPPAPPLRAFIYGVIVVANASVRLFVSPLLVCMKNDLNAVPSFASPW